MKVKTKVVKITRKKMHRDGSFTTINRIKLPRGVSMSQALDSMQTIQSDTPRGERVSASALFTKLSQKFPSAKELNVGRNGIDNHYATMSVQQKPGMTLCVPSKKLEKHDGNKTSRKKLTLRQRHGRYETLAQ